MKFINNNNRVIAIGLVTAAVVAVGGVGTADAAHLIGSPMIRNNSIRSVDIHNGAVHRVDLAPGIRRALNSVGTPGSNGQDGATGPQGPKGDTGATGATGPQGPAGAPGKDGTDGTNGVSGYDVETYDYTQVSGGGIATVACPAGDEALGGGYWFKDDSAMTDGLSVVRSMPGRMDWNTNSVKTGDYSGWIVQVNKPNNINPGTLSVYAVCAAVN